MTSVTRVLSHKKPELQLALCCSPPVVGSLPRYSVPAASQDWLFLNGVSLPDRCLMPVTDVAIQTYIHNLHKILATTGFHDILKTNQSQSRFNLKSHKLIILNSWQNSDYFSLTKSECKMQ